jgi:hypothetical protein
MSTPYKPQKYDLAGFDLVGYRQPDGSIRLGSKVIVSEFPPEVELIGVVYTLEEIVVNDKDGTLSEDHPGKHLMWGIYV